MSRPTTPNRRRRRPTKVGAVAIEVVAGHILQCPKTVAWNKRQCTSNTRNESVTITKTIPFSAPTDPVLLEHDCGQALFDTRGKCRGQKMEPGDFEGPQASVYCQLKRTQKKGKSMHPSNWYRAEHDPLFDPTLGHEDIRAERSKDSKGRVAMPIRARISWYCTKLPRSRFYGDLFRTSLGDFDIGQNHLAS